MLNWFKNKRPTTASAPSPTFSAEPAGNEPIIAALLLDRVDFNLAAARSAIAAGPIAGLAPTDLAVEKEILNFCLADDMLFVTPMGAPYPWSDLEGPCQTSWMWPRESPAMNLRNHKSHVLVVSMSGQADAITRRVRLTHTVARLVKVPGVAGIYWPEATLVHFPKIFAEMAPLATPTTPQWYLWVDFRVFRNQRGGFDCFTTGLAKLGMMEMEISGLNMPPGELRDWAINIAGYMYERGAVIPHGDTIGATAQQQLRVTHGASRFGAQGVVMRFGA